MCAAKCDSQIRLCHFLLALLTALACREDGAFPVEWGPVQIVFAMLGIHPMRHPCSLYLLYLGHLHARNLPNSEEKTRGNGRTRVSLKISYTVLCCCTLGDPLSYAVPGPLTAACC